MNSDNILVKLNNVGFSQNDKWLVKDVSLIVEKGKIVTLIGPNGSGKSTTAKIALGIYKNIEGNVEKYTDNIGYVPQKISIDWTLPLRVSDFMTLTETIKDDEINDALSLTGVTHLKNKNLGNISSSKNKILNQLNLLSNKNSNSSGLLSVTSFGKNQIAYTYIRKTNQEDSIFKSDIIKGKYQKNTIFIDTTDSKEVYKIILENYIISSTQDIVLENIIRDYNVTNLKIDSDFLKIKKGTDTNDPFNIFIISNDSYRNFITRSFST